MHYIALNLYRSARRQLSQSLLPLRFDDARFTIDYSDDDYANNGTSGEPSFETVIIHRNADDLSATPTSLGSTYWEWYTDRVNWNSVVFSVRYLDSEIVDLPGPETTHVVYTSPTRNGPWTLRATTIDIVKKTISMTNFDSGNSLFITIGASTSYERWVDFGWAGDELGTNPAPFNSMQEALTQLSSGGTVKIKGDVVQTSSPEPITINQVVRLESIGGPVHIGRIP